MLVAAAASGRKTAGLPGAGRGRGQCHARKPDEHGGPAPPADRLVEEERRRDGEKNGGGEEEDHRIGERQGGDRGEEEPARHRLGRRPSEDPGIEAGVQSEPAGPGAQDQEEYGQYGEAPEGHDLADRQPLGEELHESVVDGEGEHGASHDERALEVAPGPAHATTGRARARARSRHQMKRPEPTISATPTSAVASGRSPKARKPQR